MTEQFVSERGVVARLESGQRGDQRKVREEMVGPVGGERIDSRIVGIPVACTRPALEQRNKDRSQLLVCEILKTPCSAVPEP